jgi:ssDNA-binding Zn-finger/Zn-ribbon topoisomerase 1
MADDVQPNGVCPKCGNPLTDVQTTPTGKKLIRCTTGGWDKDAKKATGCDFIKWLETPPEELDEKCPKCGNPLMMVTTRFGKKMKKCSTGGWDRETKKATGCDYVEWINGTTVPLDEECPECGSKLVLYTTASGKRMKKCSTAGWDRDAKKATGCPYVQWLKPGEELEQPEPPEEPPAE